MLAIIDYDNVKEAERSYGVEHVVRKAISFCDAAQAAPGRIRVRIYGGWYESGRLTRNAQLLWASIRSSSPVRIAWSDGTIVLADIELATATLSDPRTLISNTFRLRGMQSGLRCEARPWLNCADAASCPLESMSQFLDQGICPSSGCSIRPGTLLHRQEQKIVDAMMVADLIFDSQSTRGWNVVVTRDDDIWPGLSIASAYSNKLTHISTNEARRVPAYYSALTSPPYHRIHWS
jgi:hypothetical protein